eukprot:Selendium_serpulae@DN8886_c0_g1_i1.p1
MSTDLRQPLMPAEVASPIKSVVPTQPSTPSTASGSPLRDNLFPAEKRSVGVRTIGCVLETTENETRVAQSPESVSQLLKLGIEQVLIEESAGVKASYPDDAYRNAGAQIVKRADAWKADCVL